MSHAEPPHFLSAQTSKEILLYILGVYRIFLSQMNFQGHHHTSQVQDLSSHRGFAQVSQEVIIAGVGFLSCRISLKVLGV